MSMYHHPDLIGEYAEKPLMEVEEVTSNSTVVFDFSELSLKQNNPGVIGVRKVKPGLWTGTVIAA